ncbi:hypothetical protein K438DRAFT_1830037 [Mycena galopus ATCC 62051]|nr:hypothetical protein K438DRAFT_1830037 [Mycena galopus ATCC 62051]
MIFKFAFFALTAAAALKAAVAASIPASSNATDTCSPAIENLLSSTDAGCLAPSALNDYIALGAGNASTTAVASAVDTWLADFCGVGICSPSTLTQITTDVGSACNIDGEFNTTDFGDLRTLFCLKDSTANSFCLTETFAQSGVNSSSSTASPAEMVFLLLLVASDILAGPTCNECTKAQYQLAVASGNTDFTFINETCGADFTATLNDTVVGVTQTALTSTFKNGAGALVPTASLLVLAVVGLLVLL